MKMPWLSILGLYEHDQTIFDELVLPTAADYADIADLIVDDPFVPVKADLVNKLLIDLAELPLLYTDPRVVKPFIGIWSKTKLPYWVKIWRTMLYAYNPIWNKDGVITEQRDTTYEKAGTSSDTGSGSSTDTGTVGRSGSSSGSTEHQVTGFDTNTYSPDTRDLTSGSASETETRNLAGSRSETSSGTTSDEGESHDTFRRVEQGNIGVTTTQAMLTEERKLALDFYDMIEQAFKREFCLMVW